MFAQSLNEFGKLKKLRMKTLSFKKSKSYFEVAKRYLVGGVNSPVRAYNSVGGTPLIIKKGKGNYIFDIDNNKYFDFVLSYGPLILGHSHNRVLKKVIETLKKGFSFGATTELEIKLAEKIISAIPFLEKIRFVNSGTEALMSAIRLARAYTGKNKIIKFTGCYHGHSDALLVAAGSGIATQGLPASKGVTNESVSNTLLAQYNNINSVKKLIENNKNKIAAVVIEPVAGNMGVVLPENDFLKKLREICSKNDILLIIDEVMTGFRACFGAAHSLFGIKGDIICLGKVIGGGFPVAAYAAKSEIMNMLVPEGEVYQAGTLSGNPIAMAAGLETLNVLEEINPYDEFNKMTMLFKEMILYNAKKHSLPVQVASFGSMFNIFFSKEKVKNFEIAQNCDLNMFKKFFWKCIENGIYIPPSQFESWFLSAISNKEEIEKIFEKISNILLVI